MVDLAQARREVARWRILRILDAGQPVGVNVAVIARVLNDTRLNLTNGQLNAELDYLAKLSLIAAESDGNREIVAARLTAAGVDLVNYVSQCPAGIARPKRNT